MTHLELTQPLLSNLLRGIVLLSGTDSAEFQRPVSVHLDEGEDDVRQHLRLLGMKL